MGADATLVNMAYKAAMANVPGNYAASFNKQYEGLIAGYHAQAKAVGGALMAVQKGVGEVSKSIAERKTTEEKLLDAPISKEMAAAAYGIGHNSRHRKSRG